MPSGVQIDLFCFNEHNEAYYFWYKAISAAGPKKPIDLFHIDAHADMARARTFRRSLYPPVGRKELHYVRRFSRDVLTIQNFIYPAILNNLVRNVYFVFPGWRRFKPIRTSLRVGSLFGEGKLLKYPTWVNDSSWKVALKKALPDLKQFTYHALPIERLPAGREVILDIDLDYFVCRDSVQNQWLYTVEITREQYRQRKEFLRDETIRFSGLHFSFHDGNPYPCIKIKFKKTQEQLHLPPKKEIVGEINRLADLLKKKAVRPRVITLCRSRISGYCPASYVDFLERSLINKLREVFRLHVVGASRSFPGGS